MMRKLVILLMLGFITSNLYAQISSNDLYFRRNAVKVNLFSFAFRSVSLQYERGLNEKMSVSLGIRLMPKGALPLQTSIRNAMDIEEDDTANAGIDFVNNAQISNWAVTPEFRYYLGKKPLSGFYIAPFLRVGGYGIDWHYEYERNDGTEKSIHLKGRSTAFSAGILLGAQWHLNSHILLDWWIFGPQYGNYNVKLEAVSDFSDLTDAEKQDLETTIEGIGYNGKNFEATVTNTNMKASNKLGFPGLRTGFCIGYTF